MLSNPDQLAQTLTYNGPSGVNDTITAGPDNFGNYYLRTIGFTGENKTSISAWEKILPPGAPSIGAITAGNGSISVPFTAPSSTGGSTITGYRAFAYRESDSVIVGQVDGTTSPLSITGLVNGVSVYARISAKNDLAGYGALSAISNHATPTA